MNILRKNLTFLLLIFLCLQIAPSYAANEDFHGSFSGQLVIVNDGGTVRIQEVEFTFGDDEARIGEGSYVFLPSDSAFHIYSGFDPGGDFVEILIIIKDRTVFFTLIGQFYDDPAHGWADRFEMKFDRNFQKITFSGFEIDEDSPPFNTGGVARSGALKRIN
jgi:hypothetical protein